MKHKSKGGAKFWLQIADGATSKKWSFFLKKKSDQYDVIEKFLLELKVKGYETKAIDVHYRRKLRMDNAGENKKLEEILKFKKINFISSIPLLTVQNSTVWWSENLKQVMSKRKKC